MFKKSEKNASKSCTFACIAKFFLWIQNKREKEGKRAFER